MRRALRAALAVALVLLASGCLRFRGELAIADDATVTGTVIAAAKLADDLPVPVTPPSTVNGTGAVRTEPYSEDGYVGTRVEMNRATFAEVERFFADQGGQLVPSIPGLGTRNGGTELVAQLRMRREGDDVVVDGRFLFPDLAGRLGGATGTQFEARLAIVFPGEVRDTTGSVTGRTVTWTFRAGEAQDVHVELLEYADQALHKGLVLVVEALAILSRVRAIRCINVIYRAVVARRSTLTRSSRYVCIRRIRSVLGLRIRRIFRSGTRPGRTQMRSTRGHRPNESRAGEQHHRHHVGSHLRRR